MKDLLRTDDLSPADLRLLLRLTAQAKKDPLRWRHMLAGRTVVLYFAKPSTRTRISAETAVAHLGGVPLPVGPEELQLGRGETIGDTGRILGSYADAVIVRTYADADVARLAAATGVPVINALTDGHHPLQSITDVFTLGEVFGDPAGRRVAYLGAGNNVAHSLMQACALSGINLSLATPGSFGPDPELVTGAQKLAAEHGCVIAVGHDPVVAARGADAVYTDAWLSMGDAPDSRRDRLRELAPYRVTGQLMSLAAPWAVFLHCLPAHRGEEVAAEVIDGPQSRVFQQAANREPVARAVLRALLSGRLTGTAAAGTGATG